MLRFLRTGGKHTKLIWWILIIVTVVTFLGGFVFLFGAGLDTNQQAKMSGAVGTIDGRPVTREEWLAAVNEQRQAFRQRFGADPVDRDLKGVETTAWRNLVARRLFEAEARRAGIRVAPREILVAMQTNPPSVVTTAPVFQTNGQFDPQKYAAALRDQNQNWAPIEDLVRQQLPVRKLQERLLSSVKMSQPELEQAFRERFERAAATVVYVPGVNDTGIPQPTPADLDRAYEKYRSRFSTSARTQVEMLVVPKQIGDAEVRAAQESAQNLANRARQGEDFAMLVNDYSDVPSPNGGVIDRVFQPAEFGPELGPKVATMPVGAVTDPLRDGTRFLVFRIHERTAATPTAPAGLKVAQLVVKIRPNDETLRQQYKDLQQVRKRAAATSLGAAATEKGLATQVSEFFDANNTPQALLDVPEAGDWARGEKVGAVSTVFEGTDEFAIVQVKTQQAAGAVPRDLIADQLRQLAGIDQRVDRAKPKADAIAAALAAGRTLEQAAQAAGLVAQRVENITRRQPDPRVAASPEFVGMLFGATPGKVIGPERGFNGWYFGRLESIAAPDTALLGQMKGQLSNEIMQRRQQTFFTEFVAALKSKAKISDLRSGTY